jgi:hypothetical protein
MFAAPRTREVRWRPEHGEGLEHLTLSPDGEGIRADAVVIGSRGGRSYGVRYSIRCDAGWRVTAFDMAATDGRSLAMHSPDPGNWRFAQGPAAPAFEGCIDIDLSGTPFTNTLPIRRAKLDTQESGRAVAFRMLYVPFDTLEPIIDGQRYTPLGSHRFLYEAEDLSFQAELRVDEDGLVLDYPGLFRRLDPVEAATTDVAV